METTIDTWEYYNTIGESKFPVTKSLFFHIVTISEQGPALYSGKK